MLKANNQEARNRLVDVQFLLEEVEDYLRAVNTIVDQFNIFAPIVSLVDGIGKRIDKIQQGMIIGDKRIYDILEDTKLRDKKEENNG